MCNQLLFPKEQVLFGLNIPPAVNALLQQAVNAYDDTETAEGLLQRAQRMNPEQLEVYIARYKFYFYKLRLEEAESVAREAPVRAAGQGGFEADWQALGPASADWLRATAPSGSTCTASRPWGSFACGAWTSKAGRRFSPSFRRWIPRIRWVARCRWNWRRDCGRWQMSLNTRGLVDAAPSTPEFRWRRNRGTERKSASTCQTAGRAGGGDRCLAPEWTASSSGSQRRVTWARTFARCWSGRPASWVFQSARCRARPIAPVLPCPVCPRRCVLRWRRKLRRPAAVRSMSWSVS